jgi:hypothetical protein
MSPGVLTGKSITASLETKQLSTDTIVNNEFISRVLDNDISVSKILAAYPALHQTISTSVNRYDPRLTDTLKTFTSGADTFRFFIATDKEIRVSYNIETTTIRLDTAIVIGVSKAVFASKFGISKVPDLLVIRDLEGGFELKFLFNPAGKLIRMSYQIQYLE